MLTIINFVLILLLALGLYFLFRDVEDVSEYSVSKLLKLSNKCLNIENDLKESNLKSFNHRINILEKNNINVFSHRIISLEKRYELYNQFIENIKDKIKFIDKNILSLRGEILLFKDAKAINELRVNYLDFEVRFNKFSEQYKKDNKNILMNIKNSHTDYSNSLFEIKNKMEEIEKNFSLHVKNSNKMREDSIKEILDVIKKIKKKEE